MICLFKWNVPDLYLTQIPNTVLHQLCKGEHPHKALGPLYIPTTISNYSLGTVTQQGDKWSDLAQRSHLRLVEKIVNHAVLQWRGINRFEYRRGLKGREMSIWMGGLKGRARRSRLTLVPMERGSVVTGFTHSGQTPTPAWWTSIFPGLLIDWVHQCTPP